MRDLRELNQWRDRSPGVLKIWGSFGGGDGGRFFLPSPVDQAPICVIASTDGIWDHVSVSRKNRCPTWTEMEFIKRKFFHDNETCMQLHVPPAKHVNEHPYCLHIWRPVNVAIPVPPSWMVGGCSVEEAQRLEEAYLRKGE